MPQATRFGSKRFIITCMISIKESLSDFNDIKVHSVFCSYLVSDFYIRRLNRFRV